MKLRNLTAACSLALFLTNCAAVKSDNADLVITHVNVIDVLTGTVQPDQNVVIANGLIQRIESAQKAPQRASQRVDGTGKYLMPGLWDMHVHFRGGDTLTEANKNLLPLYMAHGITTVRDAGGDLTPAVYAWREQINAGNLAGPRIFTSGPKIDGPGGTWPGSLGVETPAQITAALDSLQKLKVDYVKIYESKISGEAFLNVISEAEKRGLKTTGHMPYTVTLREASERGLDASEHLYYVFKGCSSREDSLTTAIKQSLLTSKPLGLFAVLPTIYKTYDPTVAAAMFKTLADRKTAVVPTLFIQKTLANITEQDHARDTMLAYIDPRIQATYMGRYNNAKRQPKETVAFGKKLSAKFMSMIPEMQAAGVTILAGSDSGPFNSFVYPGASLQGELELLVQAGLTPAQALRAATINGATFMGVADKSGSIGPGKYADLVLLNQNPLTDISNIKKIDTVISRGKLYSAKELAESLRKIKHN
ncbi:amidohydrolase family protein [Hymenobacter radiodurans]|uniref:amidohydrolase family protein n=1 Tax=Hymenobacter radiodurans TaxID=2496028 RepID=UPI001058871A|nr:amidohydrolase family protein [Hymenobacter radiodurans]